MVLTQASPAQRSYHTKHIHIIIFAVTYNNPDVGLFLVLQTFSMLNITLQQACIFPFSVALFSYFYINTQSVIFIPFSVRNSQPYEIFTLRAGRKWGIPSGFWDPYPFYWSPVRGHDKTILLYFDHVDTVKWLAERLTQIEQFDH